MRDRNIRRKPSNGKASPRRRFRSDNQNSSARSKNALAARDKYLSMARDASVGGDRVLAEHYLQHADHYTRILVTLQEEDNRYRQEREQQIAVFEAEAEELLEAEEEEDAEDAAFAAEDEALAAAQ